MEEKLEYILQGIESAKEEDMMRIMEAVIRKRDKLSRETETVFLSLPRRERKLREESLKRICEFLLDHESPAMGKR